MKLARRCSAGFDRQGGGGRPGGCNMSKADALGTLESVPTAGYVDLQLLRRGMSPRANGEDPDHVRTLAATVNPLPPIVVHRPSMRVIDGLHRVAAARLRGDTRIPA